MNFSVFIPQLFYDIIARVLPGFFFLTLLSYGTPLWLRYIKPPVLFGGHMILDAVSYAACCYFLGWIFSTFTWYSQERDKIESLWDRIKSLWDRIKSLWLERHKPEAQTAKPYSFPRKSEYQWIRLAHPEAGFRIVKLRAEARMCEATRTAMLIVILACLVYLYVRRDSDSMIFCVQPLITILIAGSAYFGFRRFEWHIWDSYWGNISSIYKILNYSKDPVKLAADSLQPRPIPTPRIDSVSYNPVRMNSIRHRRMLPVQRRRL